ncbi:MULTISPECIES: hypothetical protein [unclassified Rathayibacter]|uniref:hypothetical protein n=1 Tax=unclassified Rathayibacter TaxID=2609250 RepID=UPI000F4CEB45|nr:MULTISPECIES: hypothetical protein [unclassified Rathayibacter]ROP48302.1 hypothetical protein EDF45_3041 [Rathayibacter sp. PhB186]ROS49132.1 hypothetical protein EDF44_3043 [Rathayibacter sp. PhB185]
MSDRPGEERRAFLRRSFAEAASTALDAAARAVPLTPRERDAAAALARIDHLVVLSFDGRPRRQVFGALDGEPGSDFAGGTDEVLTAPGPGTPGDRFTPAMLPVHTLLAHSFARADHWRADGRDPLRSLLDSVRHAGTDWSLVVDDRQGVSTTLLADPEWPHHDFAVAAAAGGALLPLSGFAGVAAAGSLPPVVLVEPRSLVDPADFAAADDPSASRSADARVAERLLHESVDAARAAESAGRRVLLLVTARGQADRPGDVPALLVASSARPGERLSAALAPTTPALLHRARFAADRRALADAGVLAVAEALSGPARPLSRYPRTAPAFAPEDRGHSMGPALAAALAAAGVTAEPGDVEQALMMLRAAAPGASLHSPEARIRGTREGRDA